MAAAAAVAAAAMTAVDIAVERRIKAGILRAVVSTVIMVVVVIVTTVTIVITMIIIVKVAEITGKVNSAMNMGKGSTAMNSVSMVVSTENQDQNMLLWAMAIRPMRDTVRAAAAAAVGATEKITNAKGMDQADINARSRIVS